MYSIQCKMARAALGWGVRDLAKAAGVSPETVSRLERRDKFQAGEISAPDQEKKEKMNKSTLAAIRTALENAGVIFIDENGEGPGVRLRKV